ncbi:MAG: site-specific integrase [Planctomycetes bacterium]|nr:site-specific integrase [Planctomycetota bacterium]
MPRQKNPFPSYLLHAATGQAFVRIEGQNHYLGKHGTAESREAYERVVLEWKAHGRVLRRVDPTMSVAALVAAYWEHVEHENLYTKNGQVTSERSCLTIALRPVVRLFGSKPACEFGPQDLITARKALCAPPEPPKDGKRPRRDRLGPTVRKSVNKHVNRIRRVWRWAVSMQLVPASCWEALRAIEPIRRGRSDDVRESKPVPPAPLRAVVAVLRRTSPPIAAMIRLQWLTGARPGEVIQIRMADIERKGAVWIYRPQSHKTEHHDMVREIMLGPKAQRVLAPFLSLNPTAFLFGGAKPDTHITRPAYSKAILRCCDAAKVTRWSPNQLRHNAATRIRSIDGLDTSRTVLGHSDAETTLIYAEADRRKAMRFAQAHG